MEKSKEKNNKIEERKIIVLVIAIVVVMASIYGILSFINKGTDKVENEDIVKLLSGSNEAVVYIQNSDKQKCDKCEEVKKYLDSKKIQYYLYDAKKVAEKEYNKTLQNLNINPNDFDYPAVIYIKDGFMYANIININSTKIVDQFIKDYKLTDVKKK